MIDMGKNEMAHTIKAWPSAAALLLAVILTAAAAPSRADEQLTPESRTRVLSIGGSVTEILYALGLADRIVAVDTTSQFPPEALEHKPNVGYMRALSAEGVLATRPSLIVAEPDAGPKEAIDQLQAASIPFVTVPDRPEPEGVIAKIRAVGEVMGVDDAAHELAEKVAADFARLAKETAKIDEPVRALFVLSAQGGRMLVAGRDTAADAVIRLAGAENAVSAFTGYKPIGDEALIAAAPDALIMMARDGEHAPDGTDILDHPAVSRTPAGRDKKLIVMDGLLLLGFGPRTPQAAGALARRLYPGHDFAPLPERPWTAAAAR